MSQAHALAAHPVTKRNIEQRINLWRRLQLRQGSCPLCFTASGVARCTSGKSLRQQQPICTYDTAPQAANRHSWAVSILSRECLVDRCVRGSVVVQWWFSGSVQWFSSPASANRRSSCISLATSRWFDPTWTGRDDAHRHDHRHGSDRTDIDPGSRISLFFLFLHAMPSIIRPSTCSGVSVGDRQGCWSDNATKATRLRPAPWSSRLLQSCCVPPTS